MFGESFRSTSHLILACSVDVEKKQVEMSFRSSDSSRTAQQSIQLSDLSEGEKVDAVVKKIEDYGLFLEVEGSKVRGLCHKSEVSLHR
jgi:rRNA biogenesis protein RRP5